MTAPSRPGVRIAAFAAGLAVVFGATFGIGRAVGPWDTDPQPSHGTVMQHDQEGMH
ncbi:hypothetical protein [Gordonia neofelifaecis]|uniref:hypothetical protein n=1 Tax=Gordonia neofelifaecis TaxID=945692 RepID=UPI0015852AB0|nr:hypothetical protein [Gordonia neofelifaecis]